MMGMEPCKDRCTQHDRRSGPWRPTWRCRCGRPRAACRRGSVSGTAGSPPWPGAPGCRRSGNAVPATTALLPVARREGVVIEISPGMQPRPDAPAPGTWLRRNAARDRHRPEREVAPAVSGRSRTDCRRRLFDNDVRHARGLLPCQGRRVEILGLARVRMDGFPPPQGLRH